MPRIRVTVEKMELGSQMFGGADEHLVARAILRIDRNGESFLTYAGLKETPGGSCSEGDLEVDWPKAYRWAFSYQRYRKEIAAYYFRLVGPEGRVIGLGPESGVEGIGIVAPFSFELDAPDKVAELADPAEASTARAIALGSLGRFRDALEAATEAIALKPEFAAAWKTKGDALNELNSIEEALEAYSRAIQLRPDYAEVWYSRAIAYSKLGRTEEKIEAYKKAVELSPGYGAAWLNLAITLSTVGNKLDDALGAVNKATELIPWDTLAWFSKGVIHTKLGQTAEALDAYKKAIAAKPDYFEAWYNIACVYASLGNKDDALEHLKRASRINPECRVKAKSDEDLGILWNDERFKQIVRA